MLTDLIGSSQWRQPLEVKTKNGAFQKEEKRELPDEEECPFLIRDLVLREETLKVSSSSFFSSYKEEKKNAGLLKTGIRKAN